MTRPDTHEGQRTGDIAVFDRLATLYDRLRPAIDPERLDAVFARADRPVERVLDVGGGSGQAVRALDLPERLVIDAAPGMVARARSHGLAGLAGDAARLPLVDQTIDAVVILDALHHMARPQAVLTEAARVLRPGGVLCVVEFDPTTLRGRLLAAGEHLLGMDSVFFPPGDLESMIRATGLQVSTPQLGFEYTVVGRKPSYR